MEPEDVDLGTGHEADGKEAVAGAFADEALISAELELPGEDSFLAGDAVFAEKKKFEVARKVDLSAMKMPGQHEVEGEMIRAFFRGIQKCIEEVRIMDQQETEPFKGGEVLRNAAPGTLASFAVAHAAQSKGGVTHLNGFPAVGKKDHAHFLVIASGQLPVVIPENGVKLGICAL